MSAAYSSRSLSSRVSFGSNTRMSSSRAMNAMGSSSFGYDSFNSKSAMGACEVGVCGNEKQDMQNLNERLASYLEQVRFLEQANQKLEMQIKAFYDNKLPMQGKDYSHYFKIISDLRTQIQGASVQNASIILSVDNAKLAADDFKFKYENEMNFRLTLEADMAQMRNVFGEIRLSSENLEMQITGLNEELEFLKSNHEQDLLMAREQQSGGVNVEMDCASHVDLEGILQEMRAQYESLIENSRKQSEKWYQSKVKELETAVTSSVTEIKTSQTELTDLRKIIQSLEFELQGLISSNQQLEQNLSEVGVRYSNQLNGLQMKIDYMEGNLTVLTHDIQVQASEYDLLLNLKMRLEMEIAEYRRLLEGETQSGRGKTGGSTSMANGFSRSSAASNSSSSSSSKGTVNTADSTKIATETKSVNKTIDEEANKTKVKKEEIKKVEVTKTIEVKEEKKEEIKKVEVHNPQIQRRVKTIIEEEIDGKIVRTVVDENVEDIN
nr:keratin 99 [Misgurnus anguillicaudatus]